MVIDHIVQEIRHGALAAGLFVAIAIPAIDAQGTATITGTVTTKAAAGRPLHVTIDQCGCGNELPDEDIVCDSQGRLANAEITTSSRDLILHTTNAQIEGGKPLFNVAVPVPGLNINKPVNGAGLVRLSCNTHPRMRGWMIVTDDLAALTGTDGSFRLTDVPAGTYELRVWHELLKSAPQRSLLQRDKP